MTGLRVFVTGTHGLLGSSVLRTLAARGHDPIPFEGDLTRPEDEERAIRTAGSADALIHAAAATDVNRCEQDRAWCYAANVEGTRAAVRMAAALTARLIYVSTASVFDGVDGNYRETDIPHPKNWYNLTKFIGEEIVRAAPRSVITRLNLIGAHPDAADASPTAFPRGRNFLEWLLGAIRANEDMTLFTDVRINPLSDHTIADLLVEIAERDVSDRILHLAARNVVSKADIGRFFLERHPSYGGHVTYTTSDALSALAHRPKEMWLNAERAAVVFGRKLPTVEQELERIHLNLQQ